jgi:hypothetical protein
MLHICPFRVAGNWANSEDVQDHESNLASVRIALEYAGIAFIDERATSSAGGTSVRLSRPIPPLSILTSRKPCSIRRW